jgi:hypothetical protein
VLFRLIPVSMRITLPCRPAEQLASISGQAGLMMSTVVAAARATL